MSNTKVDKSDLELTKRPGQAQGGPNAGSPIASGYQVENRRTQPQSALGRRIRSSEERGDNSPAEAEEEISENHASEATSEEKDETFREFPPPPPPPPLPRRKKMSKALKERISDHINEYLTPAITKTIVKRLERNLLDIYDDAMFNAVLVESDDADIDEHLFDDYSYSSLSPSTPLCFANGDADEGKESPGAHSENEVMNPISE